MILIHNLSKVYGQNTVLKNISMRFDEGKIYGLIGSNGCGKTTLMRCICGFSQPTSGYVVVNGCLIGGRSALRRNPELAKADPDIIGWVSDFAPNTGVIIETPGFLPHETGLQNLMLLAAMSGRADRLRTRRAMIELGLDPEEARLEVFARPASAAGLRAGVHGRPGRPDSGRTVQRDGQGVYGRST